MLNNRADHVLRGFNTRTYRSKLGIFVPRREFYKITFSILKFKCTKTQLFNGNINILRQ